MHSLKISGIVFFAILTACNSAGVQKSADENAAKIMDREDSLYKEVIEIHDEAMPKMGKLIGYQKFVQNKIDSLELVLVKKKGGYELLLKENYDSLLVKLKLAEKEMNDWMDGFNPDPKLPNKTDVINYFEDQKEKATKMRNDMFSAIESASAAIDSL